MGKQQEEDFRERLSETWLPELRAAGFSDSPWEFRRQRRPYVDVVWLQVKSDHTAAAVSLGVHLEFLPAPSGRTPDPARLEQADCEIKARLSPAGELDFWWDFGTSKREAHANADHLAETFRREGLSFFEEYSGLPGPFSSLGPSDVDSGEYARLMPIQTKVRAALFLARIYEHVGDADRAKEFARVGLRHAGVAVGPKKALREILER